ncbi:hypothetical protein GCM10029978_102510 [Actinoallomurus acanthiterrae]
MAVDEYETAREHLETLRVVISDQSDYLPRIGLPRTGPPYLLVTPPNSYYPNRLVIAGAIHGEWFYWWDSGQCLCGVRYVSQAALRITESLRAIHA